MSDKQRIELTDTEWMDIICMDRDGLPPCCANISSLRDHLISLARNGGNPPVFTSHDKLQMYLDWCFPSHDMPPLMKKIGDQIGWEPKSEPEHEASDILSGDRPIT